MKPKIYTDKNYNKYKGVYQLFLPLNFEVLIPDDESVRLLSHELEELDYTLLYKAYSAKGRNPAVDPKTMFKIIVYAYSQNIYSSRDIEKACKRDINFMWLLEGQNAPDHSTISRFRTHYLEEAGEDLFYQMIKRLEKAGEISKEVVFIDGTKIEANANKYTFVWKKSVSKWESKMFAKIQEAVDTLNGEYFQNFSVGKETCVQDMETIIRFIEDYCKEKKIVFVHGKGRRKAVIQHYYETFQRYLERQLIYDKHNSNFKDRNSYSKTDVDATFMRMKDDHMRNAQLKPGYNVQIGVDSEYIVSAAIFQDRDDVNTLIPFVTDMNEKLGFKYKAICADAGYESEENYVFLERTEQDYYIKPQTYNKQKKRSFKNDISKRENMTYEEENDVYICHNNRRLTPIFNKTRKSKTGYEADVTVYECEDCTGCEHKEKCTKSKYNKRLYVSKNFIAKREISLKNITDKKGILYRTNRSIQVEGAFGVTKNNYQFQRFLLRGKSKVKIEFLLLCFGYNINKLHSKIQNVRTKSYLFELKSA